VEGEGDAVERDIVKKEEQEGSTERERRVRENS